MSTLTALILAKNEERHISECVASVAFADEVLVIDDFSTDETVALAQASGAKVITHALNGDWSQQRNFAVSEATGDWILFVDADERISPPLADEIREVVHSGDMKAYELFYKSAEQGNANGEYDTDFFKCIAWGNLAKTIQTYTSKGLQIAIEGRVENRTYQANDGTNRYVTEVVVEGVHLIDFKKSETPKTEEVVYHDDLPF